VVDVAALQRENAELRGQVSQLVHQLAKLNERVAELLAIAQRKQRKTPAVKPPAPSPTVEGDAKLAFDERPQAPEKPDEEEKAKSPVKPTGRKKVPRTSRQRSTRFAPMRARTAAAPRSMPPTRSSRRSSTW
jgi:hypothetical protein